MTAAMLSTVRRGALRILAIPLLALGLWSSFAETAWAEPQPDVCRYLPAGTLTGPTPTEPMGVGGVEACMAEYVESLAVISVSLHKDAASAQHLMQMSINAGGGHEREISGFGERATLATTGLMASQTGALTFIRGCYMVAGAWYPKSESTIRGLLRQIDASLKGAPCPGESSPPSGSLAVGLACDTNDLDELSQVTCAASTTGLEPGSTVHYEWTVDGQPASTTESELVLTGLAPGKHTVGVRAIDDVTSATSPPESTSFTKGGGAGPGLLGGLLPGILVAGSAIGIGLAIGAIILGRRRAPAPAGSRLPPPGGRGPGAIPPGLGPQRPGPTDRPERLRPLMPGLVPPLAAPMPSARPESLARPPANEERHRTPPAVTVNVLVSGSERTKTSGRVWGDGVDAVAVGYHLTPSAGWALDTSQPRQQAHEPGMFMHDGVFTDSFTAADTVLTGTRPTMQQRWIVRTARWYDQPATLAVSVQVQVYLVNSYGEKATVPGSGTANIAVVGAAPYLKLRTAEARAYRADGADVARVYPILTLFGVPYTGGLEVAEIEQSPALPGGGKADRDHYFEATPQQFRTGPLPGYGDQTWVHPDSKKYQQALDLRCLFHLDDDYIRAVEGDLRALGQAGYPVRFSVRPTGAALGQQSIRAEVDLTVREHHAACRSRYAGNPIALRRESPAALVRLLPSRFDFGPDPLPALPRLNKPQGPQPPPHPSDPDAIYYTQIKIRVVGDDGNPVKGSRIKSDRSRYRGSMEIKNWWLEFTNQPPQDEPLRSWDQAAGKDRTRTADVRDVDEGGHLVFDSSTGTATVPYCEYDHWKEFFDPGTRYLAGQCGSVALTVKADDDAHPGKSFDVGPPCKIYVFADPDDAGLYGHAFPGLIDQDGREMRVGFFKGADILAVDPAKGVLYMAAEGAVPAVVSYVVVAALLPAAPAAGIALGLYRVATLVPTAVAGLVGVTHVAAGTGVGQLRDDFGYQFTVCRGWDVSPAEYRRVWEVLVDWKRRADRGEMLYDSKVSGGDGNCTTFTDKACQAVGIAMPFAPAAGGPVSAVRWQMSDPAFVARAIEPDSRREVVPAGSLAQFRHPWRYAGGMTMMPITQLGSWAPPIAAPPSPVVKP